ncbi:MAG: hypothetical protein KC561_01010 [Myxococcales bacterium]|nr:hypothetical protein [Myxococcales bacterium]
MSRSTVGGKNVGKVSVHRAPFLDYEGLNARLHELAAASPELVRLIEIGKSQEGRTIWVAEVTDRAAGRAEHKPALWLDGNLHATELMGSTVCLEFLRRCVEEPESVPGLARSLASHTYYVCPRINPDGAELALADHPVLLRSGTRPYPPAQAVREGFAERDVDGDGRVLTIRIPDPHGHWAVSEVDPRLMVPREPTEEGGRYYRLLPEGRYPDFDGLRYDIPADHAGLDFNRNFPAEWKPHTEQAGAGDFPTSEPEVLAVVRFITEHPNIFSGLSFHTHSGLLLRPFSDRPDDQFPWQDLEVYTQIGQTGERMTGYPACSVFHDFRGQDRSVITGAFDDWMYLHLGLLAWTVEIWSPQREAGISVSDAIGWYRSHPIEDEVRLAAWSDANLERPALVDWYPFEHPDLGLVELGGWDWFHAFRNPPLEYIEQEASRFPEWIAWHALISPRLVWRGHSVEALGGGSFLVRVAVANSGWLPTHVTQRNLERGIRGGLVVELAPPVDVKIVSGESKRAFGELSGRANKPLSNVRYNRDASDDLKVAEWVVSAPDGAKVEVIAHHPVAGRITVDLLLG